MVGKRASTDRINIQKAAIAGDHCSWGLRPLPENVSYRSGEYGPQRSFTSRVLLDRFLGPNPSQLKCRHIGLHSNPDSLSLRASPSRLRSLEDASACVA